MNTANPSTVETQDPPLEQSSEPVATPLQPKPAQAVLSLRLAIGLIGMLLASLLSIVTAGTLAAIVAAVGIPSDAGSVALIIGAACLGFLVHNRPPARVFMGDCGSLMLGFGLAGCSVLIVRTT